MPREKSGLDMSPEARAKRLKAKRDEMIKQNYPFGKWPDGTPRTRPEIPPEMRTYYKAFGLKRDGNVFAHLCDGKSVKGIQRSLDAVAGLIRDNYSAVEIIKCRRVSFTRTA